MHTIISIAVLMALAHTQVLDICTEYCNFLKSNQFVLFWRPDCACSLENHRSNYKNNKVTKFKRHPPLDSSAIYYEPPDEYNYRTSFVDYPFYIVNPIYQKHSSKNTEEEEVRRNATNLPYREDHNGSVKKRKQNEIIARTIDVEAKDSPLYLDIDIYKSIKNERSNNIKANKLKEIELTEDDLIECIDLHILVYSRKSQDDTANLKGMWDETKISKYKDLSDSDLLIEIESKCHQPTKIVNASLEEIRNSWPRKSQLRSTEDIETVKYHNNEKMTTEITFTEASTLSNSTTKIVLENGNMLSNPTEESIETVTLLPKTNDSNIIKYANFAPNFGSSNISEVDWSTDSTTAENISLKPFIDITPDIVESNSNAEIIDFKNNNIIIEKNIKLINDSLSQYSNNFPTLTLGSTTVVDSFDTNSKFLTKDAIKTSARSAQSEDNFIKQGNNTISKPFVSNQRIEIIEKDIQIPRIITKESKNTTESSINGTELIPNNDFEDKPMLSNDLTKKYLTDTSLTKVTTAEKVFINKLFENPTKDPSYNLGYITKTTKSNDDFKRDDKTHLGVKELNGENISPEFQSANISYINATKTFEKKSNEELYENSNKNENNSNKSITNEPLVPKKSTLNNNNENKTKDTMNSRSQTLKSLMEAQKNSYDISPVFKLHNNSDIIATKQTEFSPGKANETQKVEEIFLGSRNESPDLQLFKDSKKNGSQITTGDSKFSTNQDVSSELLTSQNMTTYKNENIEDRTSYLQNSLKSLYNTDENKSKINHISVSKDITNISELSNISNEAQNSGLTMHLNVSHNFPSLNYSDINKPQLKEKEASSLTSSDLTTESGSFAEIHKSSNGNVENGKRFSTNHDKTESFINREVLVMHLLNKTNANVPIIPKEETNYPMTQGFTQPQGTLDYSNTTEQMEKVTRNYSNQGFSSDFVSDTPIQNTTQEEYTTSSNQEVLPDISKSFDDLILNKNAILDQPRYSVTTDESHDLKLDSSITNRLIKVQEDGFSLSSQDIAGKLYFLFGENKVPARFVQNSDGHIKLGLDGETLCDKIIQKDGNDSLMFKAICNSCIRYKNCTNNE